MTSGGLPHGGARMLTSDLAERAPHGIVGSLPRDSERRAAGCELLVSRYRWLVRSCVRRYPYSPEPWIKILDLPNGIVVLPDRPLHPVAGCRAVRRHRTQTGTPPRGAAPFRLEERQDPPASRHISRAGVP